jgi:hypothetical protein
MLNFPRLTAAALLGAVLSVGALAQAAEDKKPDGTVTIDETQFGLIVGGSTGGGVLTYRGKQHPFKLSGISLGANVGMSRMDASGEVYNLTDLAQFPGTYTKLDANVALGGGVGGLRLKNENGVIMRLESRTQGLQINVGVSGVKVTLD